MDVVESDGNAENWLRISWCCPLEFPTDAIHDDSASGIRSDNEACSGVEEIMALDGTTVRATGITSTLPVMWWKGVQLCRL
jgi:hypothetical protein